MFTNLNQNKPILIVVVVVEPVTKSSKKQCLSVQAAAANHCRLQINNLFIAFKCSRNRPSNRFHPYKKLQSSRRWSLPCTNQLSIRCLSTFVRWSNILCLSLVVVVHKTVRCSLFCLRLKVRFTKYCFSFKAMSQIFDKFDIKDILPSASSLHPSFSSCIKYSLCPASHA